MSDEEFYDEEYDDDWLLWDEGEDNLVDDLASGTVHLPVYLTDQALYAALDSDSDWDYYTDEYYDDDPGLVKQGEPDLPRGTKRKRQADETEQTGPKGEKRRFLDVNSFRGVIWRMPHHSSSHEQLYEIGQGKSVSFLGNWRELFQHPDNKSSSNIPQNLSSKRKASFKGKIPFRKRNDVQKPDSYSSTHPSPCLEDCDGDTGFDDESETRDAFTPPPYHCNDTQQAIIERANKLSTRSTNVSTQQKRPSNLKQVANIEAITPPSSTTPSVFQSSSGDPSPDEEKSENSCTAEPQPGLSSGIQVVVGVPKSSELSFPINTNSYLLSGEQLPRGTKRKAKSSTSAECNGQPEKKGKRGRPKKKVKFDFSEVNSADASGAVPAEARNRLRHTKKQN